MNPQPIMQGLDHRTTSLLPDLPPLLGGYPANLGLDRVERKRCSAAILPLLI